MFSLNSLNTQNQILVSFSQLSSRYSSVFRHRKQNSGKSKNVRAQESSAPVYDAIICKESLEETIRNFDKNVLRYVQNTDEAEYGYTIACYIKKDDIVFGTSL